MTAQLRAITPVRISVSGENQTGPETQKDRTAKRAEAEGATVVGVPTDIGVSGELSPWLRPDLGDWLNNRIDEFDLIIILKIDRISRNAQDFNKLIEWCKEHDKGLISCEEGFDLKTPWGEMVAKILAILAEAELTAMKSRNRASREAMRKTGRWPGGLVPFGRRAVKGEDGFRLEFDPEYGPVLLEAVRRFINEPSYENIADWLNSKGIPTVQDIARIRAMKGDSTTRLADPKPKGKKWYGPSLKPLLSSRSLLGEYVRADGSVVRDEDGRPVMRSEPVLTPEEFELLQRAIASAGVTRGNGTYKPSPLVGTFFCRDCGSPYYYSKSNRKNRRARYRHRHIAKKADTPTPPCSGLRFYADDVHQLVEETIIARVGHLERMDKLTVTEDPRATTLAIIDGRISQLTTDLQKGGIEATAFAQEMTRLANEREAAMSTRGARSVKRWRPTGLTYSEWWKSSTVDERRDFLRQNKVRIEAARGVNTDLILWIDFGDLTEVLEEQGAKRISEPASFLPEGEASEGILSQLRIEQLVLH